MNISMSEFIGIISSPFSILNLNIFNVGPYKLLDFIFLNLNILIKNLINKKSFGKSLNHNKHCLNPNSLSIL